MFEITGPKASRPPFTGIFRKTLEQSKNDLKQLDAFLINYSLLWKPEFLFAFGLYLQQKNTEYNQSADTKIRNSVVDIYVYIKTKQTQLSLKVFFAHVLFSHTEYIYSHFKAAKEWLIPSRRYTSQRREHYHRLFI